MWQNSKCCANTSHANFKKNQFRPKKFLMQNNPKVFFQFCFVMRDECFRQVCANGVKFQKENVIQKKIGRKEANFYNCNDHIWFMNKP